MKNDTAKAADAAPEQKAEKARDGGLVLLRDHTHKDVKYPKGSTIYPDELGLTEKQIGWLQGVGTVA